MKRRNFAAAGAFLVTLLVAALAAASVSAATSSQKSAKASGKGWELKAGHVNSKGQNLPAKLAGTAQFQPTTSNAHPQLPTSFAPSNAKAVGAVNRGIPGKLTKSGGNAPSSAAAPSAAFIPHAHSLPVTSNKYSGSAPGLNAYQNESTHGFVGDYSTTPPDQGLGAGNGFVFEAVNNVFAITDQNFGHMTNAEPMEQFWAPAILATGFCNVSDPKVHWDPVTRKWFVTEVAYGPPGCAPGSAIFLAVSTTSDPLSIYNIYVIDTSFDGSTCTADGCLADQPLLGMDNHALVISTNSYDWDTPTFNGAQLYILDSSALAAGFVFPNLVYFDVGNNVPTPEGFIGCGLTQIYPDDAYCWYTLQPATSQAGAFTTSRGGTEFMTSALDWFGSVDNRVAVWALTNTSSISSFFPDLFLNYAIASTESYGFPFTDTPFFSPYAEQPSSGNTPFCDFFTGPFCEPGPIANNDDRMNQLEAYKPPTSAAHLWSGLNTDALVADPLGHLHRRSAIAYFDSKPTAWCGPFICGAGLYSQGYVANWNNDVVFPAIGVSSVCNAACGENAAMVYTLTGNNHFPSVAVNKLNDSSAPGSIPVVLAGQDVLDDFAWYFFGTPRWGDYSGEQADGHSIFLATEYIQAPSCDDATYVSDIINGLWPCTSTGHPRGVYTNWGTGLVKVNY